jgi:hypothetical protein
MPNRIELQTSRDSYQLKKKGEDISPLKMMIKTSNLQFQIGNVSPKHNNNSSSLKASQRIFFKNSNG